MSCRFDRATRTRVLVDMELDVDPTGSTIELFVDGAWHPADWQGTPIQATYTDRRTGELRTRWEQTARSTQFFGGYAVDNLSTVLLASGRHATRTRVTLASGDLLADDSTPIDVD